MPDRDHQFYKYLSVQTEGHPDADLSGEHIAFSNSSFSVPVLLSYGKKLSSGGNPFHEITGNFPGGRNYFNLPGIQKHPRR
jgi:hypothetical protein